VVTKQIGVLLVVIGGATALIAALVIGESGFGWLLRVVGIVLAVAGMVAVVRGPSHGGLDE
jgi:hypothetical protein